MSSTAWVRHEGSWHASGGRVIYDVGDGTMTAGAVQPISYDPAILPMTTWYVATTGNDSTGTGTAGAPFATLDKAVSMVSGAGQAIVVGDGTYAASGTQISVTTAMTGLLITAASGATPIFDGSIAAPTSTTVDGSLRKFSYVQMPATTNAEGANLTGGSFPSATFDTGGTPTGLAADRGFANISSASDYSIPAAQNVASSSSPRVIVGIYPDQVWVAGVPLKQVFIKSLVRAGYFWVDRDHSNDSATSRTTDLYLHPTDAADMTQVRVSNSNGNFIHIAADNVTIRGITIRRHSPSTAFFAIGTGTGIDGLKLEDVVIENCASISIKLFGNFNGTTFDDTKIIKNPILNRVTVRNAGWMGLSAQYVNDARISHSLFEQINVGGEFSPAPKSGAIKATKNHRMVVEHSIFSEMGGHGVWLDQSNYDCTVASNYFVDISGSALFWEIGHRLLVVNNVLVRSVDTGINVRISGASGTWLVNNTIVGGATPLYVIAETRGQNYTGSRSLAEHAERYGPGDYDADSPAGDSSDLDKARPGEYHSTLANVTSGMNWMARAEAIVNNVIAHYSTGTGTETMALYIRPKTGDSAVNVPAIQVVPLTDDLFDGNIYQVAGGRLGQVDVRAPQTGGTTVMANLSGWRGTSGLRNDGLYGASGTPEAHGLEGQGPHGAGWVGRDGQPSADLDLVQGTAAPLTTSDSAMFERITAYISPDLRRYGSDLTPPGGWS